MQCLTYYRLGGTAPKGWGEPYVLIPLILGLATIICFVLWQAAYKHPLMPLHVWRDLDFAIVRCPQQFIPGTC